MSLMLKGIDLPEDGGTIVIKIKGSKIYREYPRYKFQPTRCKDAKAIQIPKDHGNIIDESKAVVTETIDGYYEITAPTILESEEKNESNIRKD